MKCDYNGVLGSQTAISFHFLAHSRDDCIVWGYPIPPCLQVCLVASVFGLGGNSSLLVLYKSDSKREVSVTDTDDLSEIQNRLTDSIAVL